MGEVKVSMLMSLDGIVQDPGGFGELEHGGWALAGFTEESRVAATEQLERGGDVLPYGSISLVRTLLANGLVDVLELSRYPEVLGNGLRLFGSSRHGRHLVAANPTSSGVVVLIYRSAP